MKDRRFIEKMVAETVEDIQNLIELDLLRAYNIGYKAGFESKEYADSGHCTGCVYESVPHYKEPCSDCKHSHQNLYKEKG